MSNKITKMYLNTIIKIETNQYGNGLIFKCSPLPTTIIFFFGFAK